MAVNFLTLTQAAERIPIRRRDAMALIRESGLVRMFKGRPAFLESDLERLGLDEPLPSNPTPAPTAIPTDGDLAP